MDTSKHDMPALFLQLGLANSEQEIAQFIEKHKPLTRNTEMPQAEFWNPSQASFLFQAIAEDSDWCEIVNELDSRLR